MDTTLFRPMISDLKNRYGIENKSIILGIASVWDNRKGFDKFIKLSELLDSDFQIILIGLTEKQITYLSKKIIGITRTESVQKLVEFYCASSVFLNFSLEETFGLVTVEALACGVPAIGYASTATTEIVNKSCGKLFEIHDEIEKISQYINSNQWKSILKTSCISRANEFGILKMIDNYLLLYKK